jgi:phosphatidylglycerophosphate synthase/ribosomal protein S15P/S13E
MGSVCSSFLLATTNSATHKKSCMENHKYAAQVTVNSNWKYNVLGLTTIERTLIALSKAGVSDAAVLTDEAEALRAHLSKNVKDIRLHFFQKNETEAARKLIVVQQPNAVFVFNEPLAVDISVLEDLKKTPEAGGNTGTLGGEVVLLQLTDFQSDGRRAPINPMVFGNRSCHPVRSEEELEAVKARLIRNLTKPTDGWASRNLNRPISTRISRVLVYTGITPNQFTFITGLLAFIPVYFVLKGGYWNWLIGAAIYHLASVLDGVDGEIARLKMLSSKFGQWLDTIFDFASMFAVLIALVISVQNPVHDQPFFIQKAGYVAMWAAIGAIVSILIYTIRHKRGGTFYIPYTYLSSESRWAKILQKVNNIGKRDFYIFFFLLLAIVGQFPFALVYVAVMAVLVFFLSLQTHFTKPV